MYAPIGRNLMLSGFMSMKRKGGRVVLCGFFGFMREEVGKVAFVICNKVVASRFMCEKCFVLLKRYFCVSWCKRLGHMNTGLPVLEQVGITM